MVVTCILRCNTSLIFICSTERTLYSEVSVLTPTHINGGHLHFEMEYISYFRRCLHDLRNRRMYFLHIFFQWFQCYLRFVDQGWLIDVLNVAENTGTQRQQGHMPAYVVTLLCSGEELSAICEPLFPEKPMANFAQNFDVIYQARSWDKDSKVHYVLRLSLKSRHQIMSSSYIL